MSYCCNICDKTIKDKSKNSQIKSNIHKELAKSFHKIYSVENPKFFDVDDIYNEFINVHKRKIIFMPLNVILL